MSQPSAVYLGDVAAFVRGVTFKPKDVVPFRSLGSVACMRTKNVQAELDLSDVWALPEALVKRPNQLLNLGDLLVSSANSWNLVGKCCWVPELPWPSTFGGFVSVLRGDQTLIEPRYLYYWFSSPHIQATVRSFGQQTTNISNLNIARCLGLPIPLPSIAEQRRIAEILDKADSLCAKRRASLAQLDVLKQSIFLEMFGDPAENPKRWPSALLGQLISIGPQNGLYKPASCYGSGTHILRIDAFYDGVVTDITRLKRVRLSDDELKLFGLRRGEVVINRVNSREYLGKSALIPELSEPVVFESNMMRFDVDRSVLNTHYLVEYLQTRFFRRHILRCAKDAVNQSSINQQDVKTLPVLLPPMEVQESFVRRLLSIGHIRSISQASLVRFDALFASLQHRAFRGEL